MSDFGGLTEMEANVALSRWLVDYINGHPDDCLFTGRSVIETQHFTYHLDSCSLIETRLSDEQLTKYHLAILYAAPKTCHDAPHLFHKHLIKLDAPTRVRALVEVLEIGKGAANHGGE